MAKKNLDRRTVSLLRKAQKFLISEPRRFDMKEGIVPSEMVPTILEQPPCGTACCIAGAMYVIDYQMPLEKSGVSFLTIDQYVKNNTSMKDMDMRDRLFCLIYDHNSSIESHWPKFYDTAYKAAKTPLERACIGVARIEHFIQTDGRE